jgi:hypothetical protein
VSKSSKKSKQSTNSKPKPPTRGPRTAKAATRANTSAPVAPKATKPARAAHAASAPTRASAINAAAQVLASAKTPMNCRDLIAEMAKRHLWESPGGKTPAATLSSAILREIKTKGAASRFRKTGRGLFEAGKGA